MLPKLFDIENGVLTPTEHCYRIKFLKDIMDGFPSQYLSIYSYLHYMTSPDFSDNPYLQLPEEDREETILKDVGATFSSEGDQVIEIALIKCKKLNQTMKYRAWEAQKIAYEGLVTFLKTEKATTGRDGSVAEIRRTMKEMPELGQSYDKVYSELIEENKGRTRGDIEKDYDL